MYKFHKSAYTYFIPLILAFIHKLFSRKSISTCIVHFNCSIFQYSSFYILPLDFLIHFPRNCRDQLSPFCGTFDAIKSSCYLFLCANKPSQFILVLLMYRSSSKLSCLKHLFDESNVKRHSFLRYILFWRYILKTLKTNSNYQLTDFDSAIK